MPKPDGTMTFEEWLEEEAKVVQFEEGDSPKKFLKLGREVLEEEVRKEEEKLRRQRLRRYLGENTLSGTKNHMERNLFNCLPLTLSFQP